MKRVAIVNTHVPFVKGGAEILAENLRKAVEDYGYECELIKIPFRWYPFHKIPSQMLMNRLIDLSEAAGEKIDYLIALKFPVYYVKHPNKRLWILHLHRTAYEFWKTPLCDIPDNVAGRAIKSMIHKADRKYLPEAKKIFTLSKVVTRRLKFYLNIDSKPLYHPPPLADKFYCESFESYVFFPSRIAPNKRQYLAVEAFKFVKEGLKLVIAGRPDNSIVLRQLLKQIEELGLSNRIKVLTNISDEEKLRLYANALAVLYPTIDEDYGYVTLEGMLSSKPVIVCSDSGAPLEFVQDGVTGLVAEPTPESIATKLNLLTPEIAKGIGKNAKEYILSLNLSWNSVVEELLG